MSVTRDIKRLLLRADISGGEAKSCLCGLLFKCRMGSGCVRGVSTRLNLAFSQPCEIKVVIVSHGCKIGLRRSRRACACCASYLGHRIVRVGGEPVCVEFLGGFILLFRRAGSVRARRRVREVLKSLSDHTPFTKLVRDAYVLNTTCEGPTSFNGDCRRTGGLVPGGSVLPGPAGGGMVDTDSVNVCGCVFGDNGRRRVVSCYGRGLGQLRVCSGTGNSFLVSALLGCCVYNFGIRGATRVVCIRHGSLRCHLGGVRRVLRVDLSSSVRCLSMIGYVLMGELVFG